MTALGDDRASYFPVRRKVEPWTASLQTPALAGVYFAASITAFLFGSPFVGLNFLFACLYANPHLILDLQQRYGRTLRRWKLHPVMVTGCLLGMVGGGAMVFSIVDPAHAQFFGNTQTFLEGIAGENAEVVTLLMQVIRGLFVIYMLFALVQVINAARQGEEWKDLAKTPFLIMLIGVLGDTLTGAIVGP